jgi:hypothetical protein
MGIAVGCSSSDSSSTGDEQDVKSSNACTKAGGKCVALAPGSCNGTVIHELCGTGGQLGIQCCKENPPPLNACESAGGKCVALAPGSCKGTVLHELCGTGGQLGIECCKE